ncbi:MAG TPA: M56 family metallopeptidase [Solirubrobacteraceae bacterium]|nr:M56 family metallopeptidase [Solirubrobacteraceae bacterium]
MIAVAALLVGAAITSPHVLRLESAHPASAAIIWLSALCLRALVALFVALLAIFYVSTTPGFHHVTHWCWHAAVPLVTSGFGLSGHRVGDLALLAPLLALAVSLVAVCVSLWRATRAIGDWVRRTSIGTGAHESLVVGENDIVVAVAGLRHPRVIVSSGALTCFDDEELEASLAHERGHIARRHRFVLVAAEICRALARPLPGTRRAVAELIFHLERDADRWAVQRKHDPTALASAICKAAQPNAGSGGPLLTLNGGAVVRRVQQLLDCTTPPRRRARLDVLAATMVLIAIALAAALPSATRAAMAGQGSTVHPCDH